MGSSGRAKAACIDCMAEEGLPVAAESAAEDGSCCSRCWASGIDRMLWSALRMGS